jgi:micrococcal nuclease
MFRLICPFLICLLIPLQALAWQGKAIHISDGDTITVLTSDKQQVRIRLYGIDAPEMGQDFGRRAKDFASSMVGNKMVDVEVLDTDRYGRTVAVILVDGKNLNEELIRAGLAWVYPQYCKATFCREWYRLEEAARKAKIGLWSHPDAVPPWEYRRGGKTPQKGTQEAVGGYITGT